MTENPASFQLPDSDIRIAFFVSPHGFGHAARASAVMSDIHRILPSVVFDVLTTVPRWFFADSVSCRFDYHEYETDIGLAQASSLREDISETLIRLDRFLPFRRDKVQHLAQQVRQLQCRLVLCDIAPLGITVARAAGVPSVLIENFTWDWIYAGYLDDEPALRQHVDYLTQVFGSADYHIQTEPVCMPQSADLVTRPVARECKSSARTIRQRLGIPLGAHTVLITMGGISEPHGFLNRLEAWPETYFVIPGASQSMERNGNLILLPHRSDFYHPDLVRASDVVIGKAGYSTVAETYQAGVPFGFVPRARFRESAALKSFIQTEMAGLEIPETEFSTGAWLRSLPDLFALPRIKCPSRNGRGQIARFVRGLLR